MCTIFIIANSFYWKYRAAILLYISHSCYTSFSLPRHIYKKIFNIQYSIFNIQYSIFNKIIIITLIIVIPLSLLNGTIDMISNTFGINYIIFFVNAAITSLLFFHICACFSPKRSIEILSNGTLLILGTHMIYISIWNTITGHININRQFSATFISLIVLICSIYFTKKAANNHSCLLGK